MVASIHLVLRERKPSYSLGCVSFFCTKLCCSSRGGRRTSQKGFAPGVASAWTGHGWLRDGLSRRRGSSNPTGMRQSMPLYSPEDKEPHGTLEPLLTLCEPPLRAQRLSLCQRGL